MSALAGFGLGILATLLALLGLGRWAVRHLASPPAGALPEGTVPTSSGTVANAKVRMREHAVAILNADDGGRRRVVESQQENAP